MTSAFSSETPEPRSRRRLMSHGEIGDALIAEVKTALEALEQLPEYLTPVDASAGTTLRATFTEVQQRLARSELQVVIVGEKQAGKSTLLDALVGDRQLGAARKQCRAVTFLRSRMTPSYRARYASGKVEDFARSEPDRSQQIGEQLQEVEDALRRIRVDKEHEQNLLEPARRQLAQAEAELARSESALVEARAAAQQHQSQLALVEQRARQVETDLERSEQVIPASVRNPRVWWALWSWLLFAFFMLFKRRIWDRYLELGSERARLRGELDAAHRSASQAHRACVQAEEETAPARRAVEEGRAALAATKKRLEEAEAELERLQSAVEDLRSTHAQHIDERLRRFFTNLKAVSERHNPRDQLIELAIDYPCRLLPVDIAIIDTPDLTEETTVEQSHAWEVVRQTDGCILVSELDRPVGKVTKDFLQRLREVAPHVLLVLTKMDKAFEHAVQRGAVNPWEQMEHARRIGIRRFAREIGRDPASVLAISVAAQVAVAGKQDPQGLTLHFETETTKLFRLLRHERALILGARAGTALRRCISGAIDPGQQALQAYEKRIANLEAQRTPDPQVFRAEQLEVTCDALDRAAREAVLQASQAARRGIEDMRSRWLQAVQTCRTSAGLAQVAQRFDRDLSLQVILVEDEAYGALRSAAQTGFGSIAQQSFEALRARYQLLHNVQPALEEWPSLERADWPKSRPPSVEAGTQDAWTDFKKRRIAWGVAGAVLGASMGALLADPRWAAPSGALVGSLLALAPTPHPVRRRIAATIEQVLGEREQSLLRRLATEETKIASRLRELLEFELDSAIGRFSGWIAEPIEAEQAAILRERMKYSELHSLRHQLESHDQRLRVLMKRAADFSVGLCR